MKRMLALHKLINKVYITQTEKGKKQSKSEEKVKFTVGDLTNYNLLKEKVE